MSELVLYRIKPVDKKSIEVCYNAYKETDTDDVISWSVTELYRWGCGFVENEHELPYSDSRFVIIDPNIGDGCDLEDEINIDFEFDDEITEEERAEIERCYCEGDDDGRSYAAWLFDGDHNWKVDSDYVKIYGPVTVDKITYQDYNIVSIEPIELKPRPPLDSNSAWPFK